jgi:hypothetical protein
MRYSRTLIGNFYRYAVPGMLQVAFGVPGDATWHEAVGRWWANPCGVSPPRLWSAYKDVFARHVQQV